MQHQAGRVSVTAASSERISATSIAEGNSYAVILIKEWKSGSLTHSTWIKAGEVTSY